MHRVIVIGGGVSGLATAYRIVSALDRRGEPVRTVVLESESRPGGRIWTERTGGFQIEHGATSFLDSKPTTIDLCRELELDSELVAASPSAKNRYIYTKDALHALPDGLVQFLKSGLLSWRGKVRLLCERWVPARPADGDESIHDFASRRLGREAASILVDAMVTGIHAGDPALLSVAAAFPRMVELEREHGGLFRGMAAIKQRRMEEAKASAHKKITSPAPGPGGTPWSLKQGMGHLIERLAENPSFELLCNAPALRLEFGSQPRWAVSAKHGDHWPADAVILACPSYVQAELLERLDSGLAQRLAEIRYNSVTVVALGFRVGDVPVPVEGFGYLVPQRTRHDVLGVLWNSSIFENRAPPGTVLLQAMCGGWNRPDIASWDDHKLLRTAAAELRRTLQITGDPIFTKIIRWPQAIPQYHIGHSERVAAIESLRKRHPGLFLTGNSFRGVGVNDCTEESIRCANEVASYLGQL